MRKKPKPVPGYKRELACALEDLYTLRFGIGLLKDHNGGLEPYQLDLLGRIERGITLLQQRLTSPPPAASS